MSQGSIILTYEKLAGEPTHVFYVPLIEILRSENNSASTTAFLLGVETIKVDPMSSTMKFSGVFSQQFNMLFYFSFDETKSDPFTVFALSERFGGYYKWQHSNQLLGYVQNTDVEFVAYYDQSDAENYYITMFRDDGSSYMSVIDTVFFREIDTGSSQSWYLSVAESITDDTLSWTGFGIVDGVNYVYLETA